jgi:two-component system, chemotaxis family, chemotaxis protein CheY
MDRTLFADDDHTVSGFARVLIVDDAACFRSVARALLERRGYEVAGEARSVATALVAFERLRPDAALIDIHLPDGNGFDLAARLTAADPRLAVLMTSVAFEETFYVFADASGARGFVPKPVLGQADLEQFWPAYGRLVS